MIYQNLKAKSNLLSVVGLGYVGLPLALAFARHFKVIGFDINTERINLMKQGIDPSRELGPEVFEGCDIEFTSNPEDLKRAHFHVVAVPTDIDEHKVPDLMPLIGASRNVGLALKPGDYVVYESTVYPGCTEEDCVPVIEEASGLKAGIDFKYGYSPERIVPGDKERTLSSIRKIVSGCDEQALEEIAAVYGEIIEAGLHRTSSVKVAEAAKIIENTQRDINISLMNELAIIFDRIGIDTREVIEAAATKWNFHAYYPGLVGGHCISVDPYYLIHKARELGYEPEVIAAGRRINDYMPHFIAQRIVQSLISKGKNPGKCRVLIMGITFKENVADIRNTKVVELLRAMEGYSVEVDVTDPYASAAEVAKKFGVRITEPSGKYDAVVLTVGHDQYRKLTLSDFGQWMDLEEGLLFDIKHILREDLRALGERYIAL